MSAPTVQSAAEPSPLLELEEAARKGLALALLKLTEARSIPSNEVERVTREWVKLANDSEQDGVKAVMVEFLNLGLECYVSGSPASEAAKRWWACAARHAEVLLDQAQAMLALQDRGGRTDA